MHVCLWCVYMWTSEDNTSCAVLEHSTLFSWDRVSHWTWSQPGREQALASLCLPPAALDLQTCIQSHQTVYVYPWDANSGPHACTESLLTPESFPQIPSFDFLFGFDAVQKITNDA